MWVFFSIEKISEIEKQFWAQQMFVGCYSTFFGLYCTIIIIGSNEKKLFFFFFLFSFFSFFSILWIQIIWKRLRNAYKCYNMKHKTYTDIHMQPYGTNSSFKKWTKNLDGKKRERREGHRVRRTIKLIYRFQQNRWISYQ